jgi:uncharacterized protein (TIGR00266 family)
MEVTPRAGPAFSVGRVELAAGEAVSVEAGAMMGHSGGVELEAKIEGGLMKGLKRSVLGDASLFISKYTAPAEGGWVDISARLPGDISVLKVDGAVNLTKGSWLASSEGVEIDTKWGGFKTIAGGEGGFLVRATGQGQTVAACYGALEELTLAEGESQVLDSGHLVAFNDGLDYETRMIGKGVKGLAKSFTSGEGFVFEFRGPGQVWTQTRSQADLIAWLTKALPFSRD